METATGAAEGLKALAKKLIPYDRRMQLRRAGERIRRPLARLAYFGLARFCPCCKANLRRFTPFGVIKRPEAQCPVCGSLERHRSIWMYLTQKTNLFDGKPKRMLHVAPEPELSRLIQKVSYINYLSADLYSPDALVKVMVEMDVTDIHYPDNTFDVIYCSHVLEHVPDDKKAMREFFRVLKPGGWAVIQVPIIADKTFEDSSVTDPKERERLYGQGDHVRRYGPDYRGRLAAAGFRVTVDPFVRDLDDYAVKRFGLRRDEDVYLCRKA